MKKILTVFLALLMFISMSIPSFAAFYDTYYLEDLGMSIDIPSEYVVFTRDTSDNDPNLSVYGFDKKSLSAMMESGNIYLNAWDKDVNNEIVVTMIASPVNDFNLMSDSALSTLASSFKTEYAKSGVTIEKYEIYNHDQAKFIKLHLYSESGTDKVSGLQYYTVYDNKAINITLHSFTGKIDSENDSILMSIVDSTHFDKDPIIIPSAPETPEFVYHDQETGVEFTVPANWTQDELSKDRDYIDVKFHSNKDNGLIILYGSTDIWDKMSADEKKGLARSDINNSAFNAEDLAQVFGIEKSEITNVTYGGKEYFKYTNTTSSPFYETNVEITAICFLRVDNGYVYSFQFFGDGTNVYYKDLESMLNSVKYPTFERNQSPSSIPNFSVFSLLLSLLITIAIYSGPIMLYRYGIIKQPIEKARAKKIVIIYGIVAFLIMSVLVFVLNGRGAAGGAIVLWSWVNYKILIGGKKLITTRSDSDSSPTITEISNYNYAHADNINGDEKKDTQNQVTSGLSHQKIMYCRRCGNKRIDDSEFCSYCGNQIEKEEE